MGRSPSVEAHVHDRAVGPTSSLSLCKAYATTMEGRRRPGGPAAWRPHSARSRAVRRRRPHPGEPSRSAPVTTIYRQLSPGRPGVGGPGPSVWTALLPWDHGRQPRGDGAWPGRQEARDERPTAAMSRWGEMRCSGGSGEVPRRPEGGLSALASSPRHSAMAGVCTRREQERLPRTRCPSASAPYRRHRRPDSPSTGGIKLALHIGTSLCKQCSRVTVQGEARALSQITENRK